jgi:hypothetical protein
VKQKYEALEHKYSDLEALITELRYSDEDLALSLLVRLRAGEPVQDILQAVSPESIGDELEGDPSVGYSHSVMSSSASPSHIIYGPAGHSPPFSTLGPRFAAPVGYPNNTLAYLDPMLGVNNVSGTHAGSRLQEPIDSKEVILAISQSSASSVGKSQVCIHLHQLVAWQRGYPGPMNPNIFPVDWQGSYPETMSPERLPVDWRS